jgi:hypothetical protein
VPGTENDQRDDEERRFDALYQAYYRPILACAVRRVTPAEDAADVVADVSTTAWRRIDELPQAPADRLWRYGVAQRVIAGRPLPPVVRQDPLTARPAIACCSPPGRPQQAMAWRATRPAARRLGRR